MAGQVAKTDAEFLNDAATRIRQRISRTTQDIIDIGRDLIEVKERVGHDKFLPWIEREFEMSEDTAQRFMSKVRHFNQPRSMRSPRRA
jgi:hypothetical protein